MTRTFQTFCTWQMTAVGGLNSPRRPFTGLRRSHAGYCGRRTQCQRTTIHLMPLKSSSRCVCVKTEKIEPQRLKPRPTKIVEFSHRLKMEDLSVSPVTKVVLELVSVMPLPWPFDKFAARFKEHLAADSLERIRLMLTTCRCTRPYARMIARSCARVPGNASTCALVLF